MGGAKSGIVHNKSNETVYYTIFSVSKIPESEITKTNIGVKAGFEQVQGGNIGNAYLIQAVLETIARRRRKITHINNKGIN